MNFILFCLNQILRIYFRIRKSDLDFLQDLTVDIYCQMKLRKPQTPEIFLEYYCVERRPRMLIRREITKLIVSSNGN